MMNLFQKFKNDYVNYLLSIILPAVISGISIPLFKHLLGATGYGNFSIWFNAVLILTSILSGWITQSIILFYPSSEHKRSFSIKALSLSTRTQLIFLIPCFFIVWTISDDFILAILFSIALFATSIQFSILPIIQSGFLSKKIIFSELIRITTYITWAIILLEFSGIKNLYSLFIAVILSYSLSLVYLITQAWKFFRNDQFEKSSKVDLKKLFKKFFNYGAPLSLWFVFSYLLSYMDKLFILRRFGGEVQGNYQAIFDLLSKSIILILSPVVTSLFPILTSAYARGNRREIRELLKKLIAFEVLGLLVSSVLYWWFGASILLHILKTPETTTFKLMGFIVIIATFIWQIAILVQKRFELKLRSGILLVMVIIAFTSQITLYILFRRSSNQLIYPLGFLLSTFVYLVLVSLSELLTLSKSIRLKFFIT
jgi:O-antigen/teichoic acid export membrane protein